MTPWQTAKHHLPPTPPTPYNHQHHNFTQTLAPQRQKATQAATEHHGPLAGSKVQNPHPRKLDLSLSINLFICDWSFYSENNINFLNILIIVMFMDSKIITISAVVLLDHSHHPPVIAEHATGSTDTHAHTEIQIQFKQPPACLISLFGLLIFP